jgi:glucose/arabinose dehydrogenase/mono/diheme cytochrome c family protein
MRLCRILCTGKGPDLVKRTLVFVLELTIVAVALVAADRVQESFEVIPRWLVRLPEVDYSRDDFWTVAEYFLVVHAAVFVCAQWILGPWHLSDSRRSVDELFALAVGFALSALLVFLTSMVAFDPQFIVGIPLFAAILVLAVHLVAGISKWGLGHTISAFAGALLRRIFSVPGVLIIAFALSPGVLAKLFVSDRDIANLVTRIRITLTGTGAKAWTVTSAFPGRTFRQPILVQFPPHRKDQIYVLERAGRLLRLPWGASGQPELVLDISDRVGDVEIENGALGFDFHPEFGNPESPNRGFVYLYYTDVHGEQQVNRLSRFDLGGPDPHARAQSETPLIVWYRNNSGFHNGGAVEFGPDGFLYVGIGEMTDRDNRQSITKAITAGILRLDVDKLGKNVSHPIPRQPKKGETSGYFIPNDNPFVGHPDALEEFWAIGLRNPFRLSFDSKTGRLWAGDVGSTVWEEVDVIHGGGNYQFPYVEGRKETGETRPAKPVGEETGPVYTYQHNAFDRVVIGGIVYRGSRYPELEGKYIFGDNYSGKLFALPATGESVEKVEQLGQANQYAQRGITSFTESPDGEILITILGSATKPTGEVLKLVRRGGGESRQADRAPGDAEPVSLEASRQLFRTNCSRCHGPEGHGDGPDTPQLNVPMPDFSRKDFQASRSDEQLRGVIANGGSAYGLSTMMPPWGHSLTDAELDAMVRLVRSYREK